MIGLNRILLRFESNSQITKQSLAATCNGLKKSLQSLQKLEPSSTVSVTQYDFLCNLCCNCVARQVAACNMSSLQLVLQFFWGLQRLDKVELRSTFGKDCTDYFETTESCSSRLQRVKWLLAPCNGFCSNIARKIARQIVLCVTPAYPVQSLQAQKSCETSLLTTPLQDKLQENLHRVP